MAIPIDPKQIVSFEELLMSQVIQQEALTRCLWGKDIYRGRVSGDGEDGEQEDEEKLKIGSILRRTRNGASASKINR